jgi:TRAP transporter TAXI family solute receptor
MAKRAAGYGAAGIAGVFLLVLAAATGFGTVNVWAQRISFAIATGPSSGTYFPVGEAIAGLISHPPGSDRCGNASVCGPEGLIATAQTSAGSAANVMAVNSGRVDSALAQSDVVAEAVNGTGQFRGRKQTHIRIIASLFPEDIHLVVRRKSRITSVEGLRGKRVSIGPADSGTALTARAVLAAYRPRNVRVSIDSADSAAQKLEAGKIDAFFFVGGPPIPLVQALISSGTAALVPIDGAPRERLIARGEGLTADTISASVYGNGEAVPTLAEQSLWIVNDSEPADIVYALARALFAPSNRARLREGPHNLRLISLSQATKDLPAPLHPGAARFFRDEGQQANYTTKPL